MPTTQDDALNAELQAQMSGTKDRAHGWIGSKFVGIAAANAGSSPSTQSAPPVVGSQGKNPGEWKGSQYLGPMGGAPPPPPPPPAAPPPPQTNTSVPTNAPAPPPVSTPMQTFSHADPYPHTGSQRQKDEWRKRNPSSGPGSTPPPPPAPAPGTPLPDGTTPDVHNQPGGPGTNPNDAPAPPRPRDLTKAEYDRLTPKQRRDYFDGKINADGTPKAAAATPPAPGTTTATAPRPRSPLEGFDAGKLADPKLGTSQKYVAGRILQAGGTRDDVLKAPEFKGWVAVGSDSIMNPATGHVYDLFRDEEGDNAPQYTRINENSGGDGGGSANSAAPPDDPRWHDGIPGNAAAGGPGGTMYGGDDDEINQAIMRLLARGEQPLGADDPTLQAQFLPTRNVMERGAQMTRGAAAERMAFEGTNIAGSGGAFSGEVNSINQDLAGREGQLMSQLVTSELQSRRQDVANALTFAQGSQRMQLQQMLAALDRELAREQMKQQNDQWYDEYGRRVANDEYDQSQPPPA